MLRFFNRRDPMEAAIAEVQREEAEADAALRRAEGMPRVQSIVAQSNPADHDDMTDDEIALALVAANARLTAREHIIRRLVELMEADAPTQADWDEAIADAKEELA